MSVLAIIPAAGTGIRMGGNTPKQFLSLEGIPIFVHTLRKFDASEAIDEIFLGLRPEEMDRAFQEIAKQNFIKPVRLVAGGASRRRHAEAPSSDQVPLQGPLERRQFHPDCTAARELRRDAEASPFASIPRNASAKCGARPRGQGSLA